jgi:chromosome segregation ATPase
MVLGLIVALVSCGLIFGSLFFLKKQITSSVGAEKEALISQIPGLLKELEGLLAKSENYASRPQFEALTKMAETTQAELTKEKNSLKETETRLDRAQQSVEEKESVQQELKTSREEDDQKLQELLERYNDVSTESIELEQHLAASMKNLDSLLGEADLTPDQTAFFQELSNAMTNASSRLRDLLLEHNTVRDRLELLRQQHKDLEEEYTRLVEQQLGE